MIVLAFILTFAIVCIVIVCMYPKSRMKTVTRDDLTRLALERANDRKPK